MLALGTTLALKALKRPLRKGSALCLRANADREAGRSTWR
jgi:hypothetical protein